MRQFLVGKYQDDMILPCPDKRVRRFRILLSVKRNPGYARAERRTGWFDHKLVL